VLYGVSKECRLYELRKDVLVVCLMSIEGTVVRISDLTTASLST
jgi:hypothetical protein